MYEYYNNIVCVPGKWLYEEAGIMSKYNYDALSRRGHLNIIQSGGNGRKALVEFDSMRVDIKEATIALLGDPYQTMTSNKFVDYLIFDTKAQDFYRDHELDDGNSLPEPTIKEYTNNAIILNAIHDLSVSKRAKRSVLGKKSNSSIWEEFAKLVENLPKKEWKNSLPTTDRSLRNRLKKYKKEGYEGLIHKNFCNTNSEKLNEDSKLWTLARWSNQVQKVATIAQLFVEYNEEAQKRDWKLLKEENTLYNFLHSEDVEPYWYGHRHGELKARERYSYQHSTKLPVMRDALWYGDGTKLNFFYLKEDGKIGTTSVYEVMDAYSEVFLGYHISDSEDFAAQYSAYKMATQIAGHKPYQIGFDGQGGHAKLKNGNFLSKITRLAIKTKPYNGKSKTIESAFGRFQTQFLARHWFFTGQNITAKKTSSKVNMEFILANQANLPTLEEIKEIYAKAREEWNNAPHPNTGKTRIDTYLSSTNPQSPQISTWDMVDLFWIQREKSIKCNAYGILFTEKKVEHNYMVYKEDGMPNVEWLERSIDKSFFIKYDTEDMSLIYLYEKTASGDLRFVTEATTKVEIHRARQEQEEFEAGFIKGVQELENERRVIRRDKMDEILEAHEMDAEFYGLNNPNLKGIENKKKNKSKDSIKRKKKTKEISIGEWDKDMSNMTPKDLADYILN